MAVGASDSDIGEVSGNVITITELVWLSVVYSGDRIPADSLLYYAEGVHDGADAAAVLADSTAPFTTNQYVNFRLINRFDGSSTVITANTTNTATGVLSGGTDNAWDMGDFYEVVLDVATPDVIQYQNLTAQDGVVSVSVLGVPTVTGSNTTHTFLARIVDISDASAVSDNFTVTVDVT